MCVEFVPISSTQGQIRPWMTSGPRPVVPDADENDSLMTNIFS